MCEVGEGTAEGTDRCDYFFGEYHMGTQGSEDAAQLKNRICD